MSQRFCLFYAGYTACAPSLYYDQVALYGQLMEAESTALKQCVAELTEELDSVKSESKTFMETTLSIAKDLGIDILPRPLTAGEYITWRDQFISTVESQFPLTKIDHYYFLYGRRLAEIIANAELVKKYISLLKCAEKHDLLLRRLNKSIKDIEYVLFKMMAPAALLSGEHRHHFFSVFYRDINKAFQPFAALELKSLDVTGLDKLNNDVSEYGLQVTNGFKKCIGLLKELGV